MNSTTRPRDPAVDGLCPLCSGHLCPVGGPCLTHAAATDLQSRITSLLSPTHPTREAQLINLLLSEGETEIGVIQREVNRLHEDGRIRWVAYQGWCLGGHPS